MKATADPSMPSTNPTLQPRIKGNVAAQLLEKQLEEYLWKINSMKVISCLEAEVKINPEIQKQETSFNFIYDREILIKDLKKNEHKNFSVSLLQLFACYKNNKK